MGFSRRHEGWAFFISFQWFTSLSCESVRSKEEFDGGDCGLLLSFKNVVRRLNLAPIPPRHSDASLSKMQFEAQPNPQLLPKASTSKAPPNACGKLGGVNAEKGGGLTETMTETWNVFFG
jgi:hypothetical protein